MTMSFTEISHSFGTCQLSILYSLEDALMRMLPLKKTTKQEHRGNKNPENDNMRNE